MNPKNDPLDRLLRAASRAGVPAPREAPFGMESRVMAAWRQSPAQDETALLILWLRRSVTVACALVLLSAAWNVAAAYTNSGDELSYVDSAMQIAMDHE